MKRTIPSLFIASLLLLGTAKSSFAMADFPACANPQGSVIAQYNSGTHGIVGNLGNYTGRDSVYQVTDGQYTQCFCPDQGMGIQTNWLNAKNMTQDQVSVYTHSGWIYVADGSVWGLSADPFLAQNSDFACNGGSNSSSSSGSSDNQSNNSNSGVGGSSSVLGAATSVLSLANTGNLKFIISIFSLGIIFTALGLFFKKFSTK